MRRIRYRLALHQSIDPTSNHILCDARHRVFDSYFVECHMVNTVNIESNLTANAAIFISSMINLSYVTAYSRIHSIDAASAYHIQCSNVRYVQWQSGVEFSFVCSTNKNIYLSLWINSIEWWLSLLNGKIKNFEKWKVLSLENQEYRRRQRQRISNSVLVWNQTRIFCKLKIYWTF